MHWHLETYHIWYTLDYCHDFGRLDTGKEGEQVMIGQIILGTAIAMWALTMAMVLGMLAGELIKRLRRGKS